MNYRSIINQIAEIAKQHGRKPEEITLVAVSKGHPWNEAEALYNAGCRHFGENRLQEAIPKIAEAPFDIRWHMIGSLQKNKVAKALPLFALIHSVDSVELAQKISAESLKFNRTTQILLQANTSGEETKHGLTPDAWLQHFDQIRNLPALTIKGLMTIAPLVEDEKRIRTCFASLRQLKEKLERDGADLPELSMGMSHDFKWAIAEGATLLRIGSALFC